MYTKSYLHSVLISTWENNFTDLLEMKWEHFDIENEDFNAGCRIRLSWINQAHGNLNNNCAYKTYNVNCTLWLVSTNEITICQLVNMLSVLMRSLLPISLNGYRNARRLTRQLFRYCSWRTSSRFWKQLKTNLCPLECTSLDWKTRTPLKCQLSPGSFV